MERCELERWPVASKPAAAEARSEAEKHEKSATCGKPAL